MLRNHCLAKAYASNSVKVDKYPNENRELTNI